MMTKNSKTTKVPVKLKDIDVLRQLYDPHADGYFIAGKAKDEAAEKPYIMGWRTRKGRKLIAPQSFKSKGRLTRAYKEAVKADHWPEHDIFRKDTQHKKLYAWEELYLQAHTIRLSEKTARKVISQVCDDYSIPPLKLRWCPEGKTSWYVYSSRLIKFSHRDLISLLHEIGHAVHDEIPESRKSAHHSPAFARILVELYHRYAGFPLDYLMVTAHEFDLLGDMKTEQLIFDPIAHCPQPNIPR